MNFDQKLTAWCSKATKKRYIREAQKRGIKLSVLMREALENYLPAKKK